MNHTKHHRVMALTPTTRGVGFAVLEGKKTLVDWGVKTIQPRGDKNVKCVERIWELLDEFEPERLVIEDYEAKSSRRAPRIRKLGKMISALAAERKIKLVSFPRLSVIESFLGDAKGTKNGLAEVIAKQFPEELGSRLPPKRELWNPEDYRMGIFEAVALALMLW